MHSDPAEGAAEAALSGIPPPSEDSSPQRSRKGFLLSFLTGVMVVWGRVIPSPYPNDHLVYRSGRRSGV